jgi:hypothetical protein
MPDTDNPTAPARRPIGRPRLGRNKHLRVDDKIYVRLRAAARAADRPISDELAARLVMSLESIDADQLLIGAGQLLERISQQGTPSEMLALTEQLLTLVADENVSREIIRQKIERYISMPLGRAIQVGSLDILIPSVLDHLAGSLGCTRWEAAQWWMEIIKLVLPYTHEQLGEPTT